MGLISLASEIEYIKSIDPLVLIYKVNRQGYAQYDGFYIPFSRHALGRLVILPKPDMISHYTVVNKYRIPNDNHHFFSCKGSMPCRLILPSEFTDEIIIKGTVVNKTNRLEMDYLEWSSRTGIKSLTISGGGSRIEHYA